MSAKQQERCLVKQKLDDVSRQIRSKVSASSDIRQRMLPHLRTAIAMLRLGREIMETKLDKRLVGTVDIPDYSETVKLPDDIEGNLSLFVNTLSLTPVPSPVEKGSGMPQDVDGVHDDASAIDGNSEFEEETMLDDAMQRSLQQGVSLLDSAMKLKVQQLNAHLAGAAYDEAFDKIASDFRKQIESIDDKRAFVREVMRRANLADNDEERKQALLMLSELSGHSLSEQDFNNFINGNKTIEL